MSTITRAFTKEQLIEQAKKNIQVLRSAAERIPGASDAAVIHLKLARIALASLKAEPAIHRWRRVTSEPYGPYPWHYGDFIGFSNPVDGIEDEYYYTAPPAPVSVPEWTNEQCMEFLSIAFRHAEIKGDLQFDDIRLGVKMVNGSRAAMLNQEKSNG